MTDAAKSVILHRLADEGYSGSYGSLLFLTALMGTGAEWPKPENVEEQYEWRGHFNGLRSALACLVMHEMQAAPEAAAAVVDGHIADAVSDLDRGQSGGTG